MIIHTGESPYKWFSGLNKTDINTQLFYLIYHSDVDKKEPDTDDVVDQQCCETASYFTPAVSNFGWSMLGFDWRVLSLMLLVLS